MRLRSSLLAFVMSISAGGAATAANLIVNGGFETPDAVDGGFVQVFGGTNFGGWTVTGLDVLLIDRNYTESGLVFNAAAGNQAVDLTGAGNTSPEDGVEQTVFGLQNGRLYRLSFELGNAAPIGGNGSNYTLPSTVRVSFDGGPALSFTNAVNNPTGNPGINFQAFSTNYVANASGQVTIRFFNGIGNDNYVGLDNVSLAVPEPATWALMIMGFGGAGAMLRRRRTFATARS